MHLCVLRGHQNIFEVQDCAEDKGRISWDTSNVNRLNTVMSEGSLSPSYLTPTSLCFCLMHKYKQVLDGGCRGSSKCTCYAKTAGPLMRANYFRKQLLSCLKMCAVFICAGMREHLCSDFFFIFFYQGLQVCEACESVC